jgi:hypothetical protein
VKFRRKSAGPGADEVETPEEAAPAAPAVGPFDVDELPEDGVERVDLGSLLIAPEEDRELRLQVDETTGEVQSVMLASSDGAVELRAFAAPRGGDLWSDVRPRIAADMAQHGGVATEREGRFGTELVCQLSVTRGDGTTGTQPSRIIGINGPRWMLRATLLGRPATDPDGSAAWEDTITRVAVRRGGAAMPVGDLLPVTLPANARRLEPPTAND